MSEGTSIHASIRPKWTQVSWKRVFIALALIFVVAMALDLIQAFLHPWFSVREMSRGNPQLALSPTALHDTNRSQLFPKRIECFEFSFQTPWEQVGRRDFRTAATISFKDGVTIMALEPASTFNMSSELRKHGKTMEDFFGPRALSSQYDWMTAELTATPAQAHWWDLRGSQRTGVLLAFKVSDAIEATAIFRVGNEQLRGFQIGDPAAMPWQVKLELFDVNDRRYRLLISQNGRALTQADINAIVASMRPIPHS